MGIRVEGLVSCDGQDSSSGGGGAGGTIRLQSDHVDGSEGEIRVNGGQGTVFQYVQIIECS